MNRRRQSFADRQKEVRAKEQRERHKQIEAERKRQEEELKARVKAIHERHREREIQERMTRIRTQAPGKVVEKMASKAIEGFSERGRELYREYSAKVGVIQSNQMLSPQGKQEQLRVAESDYRGKVEALQGEARTALQREAKTVTERMKAAKVEEAVAQRKLLGPELTAHLYERRISVSSPAQIEALVEGAVDDWESVVLRELAYIEVDKRAQRGSQQDRDEVGALESKLRMSEKPKAPELEALENSANELSDVEGIVEQLDVQTYSKMLGDRLGIPAQHMTASLVGKMN